MGKCVDQVYFMEKWSKRQGLKIAISQQFSYVNSSILIKTTSRPEEFLLLVFLYFFRR